MGTVTESVEAARRLLDRYKENQGETNTDLTEAVRACLHLIEWQGVWIRQLQQDVTRLERGLPLIRP